VTLATRKMEIEYKQRISDYWNAYRHISKRLNASTRWRYLATFSSVAFGLLVTLGVIFIGKHYEKYQYLESEELNYGLMFVLVSIVVLFIGLATYNKKIRPLIFEEDGLYLSTQKFKISDDCLTQFMGDNEHKYQWKYVQDIEKTNEYIFIFLDRATALYIPRHALKSDEEYALFYEALKSHVV